MKVRELMTGAPITVSPDTSVLDARRLMLKGVIIIGPDQDARAAAQLMLEHKVGALPVLDGEVLIGILTETDILRAFARVPEAAGRI